MTNRELLESALKRVNALAGTIGRLYYDSRFGYYIEDFSTQKLFDGTRMNTGELLAYLHGIEDAYKFINK